MDLKEQRQEKRQDYFSVVKTRLKKKFKQTRAISMKSPGNEYENNKMASTTKDAAELNSAPFLSVMNPSGRTRNTDFQQYYSMEHKSEEKNGRTLVQEKPVGTMEYRAAVEDTLCSIALKFNSTPTQLVKLNKLYSQSIVPGQQLYVPDPGLSEDSSISSSPRQSQTLSSSDIEYVKLSDADSAEMSSLQWYSSQHSIHSSLSPMWDEVPFSERFLKICCRYFTNGKGVIMGILLLTPEKIFFDPYKSHPLVIENGCEDYLFSCNMESLISAVSHKDVSQMELCTSSPLKKTSVQPQTGRNTANINRRKSHPVSLVAPTKDNTQCTKVKRKDSVPVDQGAEASTKFSSISHSCPDSLCHVDEKLSDEITELQDSVPEEDGETDQKETFTIPSRTKYGGDNLISENRHCYCDEQSISEEKFGPNVNYYGNQHLTHALTEEMLHKGNKREKLCDSSYDPDDKTAAFCEINLLDHGCPEYQWCQRRENTEEKLLCSELSRMKEEEVCCAMNKAKGDLFSEYDKQKIQRKDRLPTLAPKHELKQDLHHSDDEEDKFRLMFLCLKVRLPKKGRNLFQFGSTISEDMSQNESKEYWLAMTQEKVAELHTYLKHWRPDIYLPESMGDTQFRDFVFLDGKCAFPLNEKLFGGPFDEWEIISVEDDPVKHCKDIFDSEFGNMAPILQGKSNLLEPFHIEMISKYLPLRTVGHPWRLAYSTYLHGFSLKTLYRKVANADSPVLLVLKDTCGQVFGALTSHPPRPCDHFNGTGETFLYTFNPDFKIFQWTGNNSFFTKGSSDSLAIGGGSGHFGLWLDEDLNHGRSHPCETFNNIVLSKNEDFKVQDLEVWTF
ncbi:nuclear receptor coactivator 7 isoform X1 [Hemiscyllium ocellatum]|uniref:nuclear receptor coactivator 7 isoform X1 n=1 Tax=Hemiscyllium ocellatum TaxID=170820 RepID=UPI002966B2DE|nr:nuclear receptor coactivator 7 isoform X1 [Hemiscyllium ocellatum]XP_060703555.1 nuclear receptor coactivator 7 isoform X1 [Hemiscyllium ocellatum]